MSASTPRAPDPAAAIQWLPGLSASELEAAQDRYAVRFPPDLAALYRDRMPPGSYDWRTENEALRSALDWPRALLVEAAEAKDWWSGFGARPGSARQRRRIVAAAVAGAPRLIPLRGHRFIPETPCEPGNPVFSMYGLDTIYYGANLSEYLHNEFGDGRLAGFRIGTPRRIPFWSDLAET